MNNATEDAMPKKKPVCSVRLTPAAHKKLRVYCAKTGEKLGVAATEAVIEYVKKIK